MDINKILKDLLKQEEMFKELGKPSNPLQQVLEEEAKRHRLFLEPLSNTARQIEESHRSIAESMQKSFGGRDYISDILRRNENILDALKSSTSAFARLNAESEIARHAFDKLTEQSLSAKTAFSSIAESITKKYSLETHFRLPQIEAILAKDFMVSEDVETSSASEVQIFDGTYQDINDFIEYTENSSDEEISQYFSNLGRNTKLAILWFITNVIVQFIITILGPYYYEGWNLQERLDNSPLSSSREVKQVIKNSPSYIDLSDYSGYRVVTGDRVHLRENPGKKSAVLDYIPRGKLVKVLEKGRTWTKVEIDFTDSDIPVIGWVFTRYLISIKR